ncbi:hypothetical protein NPIL_570691 [Nephila pilipes]|uniref:Uncharacterized protein n=1 Tax=Nephila pilipes TaxID=299642 RepID=A0A8X6QH89_NEPPI|nr:hypothetical protein NPIL_570691 [Nephila pilipes]
MDKQHVWSLEWPTSSRVCTTKNINSTGGPQISLSSLVVRQEEMKAIMDQKRGLMEMLVFYQNGSLWMASIWLNLGSKHYRYGGDGNAVLLKAASFKTACLCPAMSTEVYGTGSSLAASVAHGSTAGWLKWLQQFAADVPRRYQCMVSLCFGHGRAGGAPFRIYVSSRLSQYGWRCLFRKSRNGNY